MMYTEDEFGAVHGAAWNAYAKSDFKEALVLDKLARKINAYLTRQSFKREFGAAPAGVKPITWQGTPSVFSEGMLETARAAVKCQKGGCPVPEGV